MFYLILDFIVFADVSAEVGCDVLDVVLNADDDFPVADVAVDLLVE